MIRGGGPDVIVGSSHTQAAGSAVATGPNGTVYANGAGQAQTNSSWVHNPPLRRGNMIDTGPDGLLLCCNYSAQAGLIHGHGSGPVRRQPRRRVHSYVLKSQREGRMPPRCS
jgi:hypothetical protein